MRYNKDGYNKYGLSRDEQARLDSDNSTKSNISGLRSDSRVKVNPTGHFKGTTGSIFKVLIAILIGVALVRVLSGNEIISFQTLLEYLGKAPVVSMPFKFFNDLTIIGDWGLFNFFKDFLNLTTGVVSILVFLATGLINAIIYLTYFIRFIFV